jgi:hypothetical protein
MTTIGLLRAGEMRARVGGAAHAGDRRGLRVPVERAADSLRRAGGAGLPGGFRRAAAAWQRVPGADAPASTEDVARTRLHGAGA